MTPPRTTGQWHPPLQRRLVSRATDGLSDYGEPVQLGRYRSPPRSGLPLETSRRARVSPIRFRGPGPGPFLPGGRRSGFAVGGGGTSEGRTLRTSSPPISQTSASPRRILVNRSRSPAVARG